MQQWNRVPSGTQPVLQALHETCYTVPIDCSPDTELVIKGEYPHARYMSFTVFTASGDALVTVYDRELIPDEGSQNPFLSGGYWDTIKRSYTLLIRFAPPPGCGQFIPGAGCNTIYAGSSSNVRQDISLVTYRIGTTSAGYDETGGAGLPQFGCRTSVSKLAAETAVRGAFEAAREQHSEPHEETLLHELSRTKKSDIAWSRSGRYQPNQLQARTEIVDLISSAFDGDPEKLLYLHWKAPKIPDTWHDVGFTGIEDMRCWSITFLSAGGEIVLKTIRDFETITDQYGYVNLVVGFGAARTVFVTPSSGFTWVNLGGQPPDPVLILYRNILISPSFQYSANTFPIGSPVPQRQMGAYYPVGNFISLTTKAVI